LGTSTCPDAWRRATDPFVGFTSRIAYASCPPFAVKYGTRWLSSGVAYVSGTAPTSAASSTTAPVCSFTDETAPSPPGETAATCSSTYFFVAASVSADGVPTVRRPLTPRFAIEPDVALELTTATVGVPSLYVTARSPVAGAVRFGSTSAAAAFPSSSSRRPSTSSIVVAPGAPG